MRGSFPTFPGVRLPAATLSRESLPSTIWWGKFVPRENGEQAGRGAEKPLQGALAHQVPTAATRTPRAAPAQGTYLAASDEV